jgi:hypothetical protein
MSCFDTGSGTVSYQAVRNAMEGRPFTMSLTDTDDIKAVIAAVNEGIDAHLEACYCPDRGDQYEGGKRKAGKLVLCSTLECSVSPESLPVLLRRLFDSDDEAGMMLAGDILTVLGINERVPC